MKIYRDNFQEKTILELEENELTLIAYLLEKSHHNLKDKMKDPLSSELNKKVQQFIEEKM